MDPRARLHRPPPPARGDATERLRARVRLIQAGRRALERRPKRRSVDARR